MSAYALIKNTLVQHAENDQELADSVTLLELK